MVTKFISETINFEAVTRRTSNILSMHLLNRLFIKHSSSIYYALDFKCWGTK